MYEDKLKITINEVLAGAGYEIAGWSSYTRTHAEGSVRRIEGSFESAGSGLKNAVRNAIDPISEWPESGEDAIDRHREPALAEDGGIF